MSSDRKVQLAVAALLLLGTAGMGLTRWTGRASAARLVHGYSAPPAVPRIPFEGSGLPGAMLIRDFDAAGDALYLLDAAVPRVFVMQQNGDEWSLRSSFGKRGAGPGELMNPTGIALAGDSAVVVADGRSLHTFSRDGIYRSTRTPSVPCALMSPRVTTAANGLLLSGRCARGDTIFAELFHLGSNGGVTRVASDVLYSLSGGAGSILSASTFYSGDATGGLFGGGTGECIYRVHTQQPLPTATRVCDLGRQRYAFTADAQFKAKAKAIRAASPALANGLVIPDRLPLYLDHISTAGIELLLRPITNDSFAFRHTGSDKDVAIAAVDGLLGCRPVGCLWVGGDSTPTIMLLRARQLLALAKAVQ